MVSATHRPLLASHWRHDWREPALPLDRLRVLEGGIPIVHEGKIIGSIGVSGVTSQQAAQTAQAGQDALK